MWKFCTKCFISLIAQLFPLLIVNIFQNLRLFFQLFLIWIFSRRPNWLLCFHLKSNRSCLKVKIGNYIVGIMWWTVVPNIVRQAQWHICIGFGPMLIYHRFLIKSLLNAKFLHSINMRIKYAHTNNALKTSSWLYCLNHIFSWVWGYILSGWVVKEDYWGGCITLESPQ